MKKHGVLCTVLLMALFLAGTVFAQGNDGAAGKTDVPDKILQLMDPSIAINGWGKINFIEKDRIVIDDSQYRLAPNFRIKTRSGSFSYLSGLKPGQLVGFLLDRNREIKLLVAP